MDRETRDAFWAKWFDTERNGATEERRSAWNMYVLARKTFEDTYGHPYVRPEDREAENPNDT